MNTGQRKQVMINFVDLVVNMDDRVEKQVKVELTAISGGCPAHGLGQHLQLEIRKWTVVLICERCNNASAKEKYLKDASC